MEFVLYTLWFLTIAVVVNVVMENLWNRQISSLTFQKDERGSLGLDAERKPRHRG